jgi:diguanylate cyclase (GGDEF)-like protein/PAS domain S-box-containing protein
VEAARDRALRALVEGTADLVALFDQLGVIEYVSPSVTRTLGWDPEDLVGTNVLHLVHEDDLPAAMFAVYGNAVAPADGLLASDDIGTAGEYRLRHKDGRWIAVEVLGNNFLANPEIGSLLIVGRDVSARHRLDEALTELATRPVDETTLTNITTMLDELLRGTATALLVDDAWVAASASPVPKADVADGPWVRAMAAGEHVVASVDVEPYRAVWALPLGDLGCLVVWSELHDEPLLGWWATLRRVSELATLSLARLRGERALQHAAEHDALTGLLNRSGTLARVTAAEAVGALLLADLDGFKPVNDQHGHVVGDAVLAIVAQRFAGAVRPGDVVGRFGGDEFVVFLPGADAEVASSVASRLLQSLEAPIDVDGVHVRIGVSVGIDVATTHTLDERLTAADTALYRAKHAGRGQASFSFVR